MKQNQNLMTMDAQRMTSLEMCEADTGILAHQNRMLVCGYEVQRCCPCKIGTEMATIGASYRSK